MYKEFCQRERLVEAVSHVSLPSMIYDLQWREKDKIPKQKVDFALFKLSYEVTHEHRIGALFTHL